MEINLTLLNIFGIIAIVFALVMLWIERLPDNPEENEDNRGNLKSSVSKNKNKEPDL